MKKFEIHIKEINLNEDLEPIEDRHMVNAFIYDETELSDKFLQLQLENKWDDLIEKYLIKRNETPFKKLQSLAEHDKQVRKEVLDEICVDYAKRLSAFIGVKISISTAMEKLKEVLDQIQGE